MIFTPPLTCLAKSSTSAKVAPALENPVEVFIYSAPDSDTISHIFIFSASVSRQVSIITFKSLPPHAAFICFISSRTSLYLPPLSQPIFMTISISSAPFSTASAVSAHFAAVVLYPHGKPMTVHIFSLSPTYSFARLTKDAGIHTDAVEYSIPSSQSDLISSHVALGESRVWSVFESISFISIFITSYVLIKLYHTQLPFARFFKKVLAKGDGK